MTYRYTSSLVWVFWFFFSDCEPDKYLQLLKRWKENELTLDAVCFLHHASSTNVRRQSFLVLGIVEKKKEKKAWFEFSFLPKNPAKPQLALKRGKLLPTESNALPLSLDKTTFNTEVNIKNTANITSLFFWCIFQFQYFSIFYHLYMLYNLRLDY